MPSREVEYYQLGDNHFLLTAMLLVAVMFVVVVAALAMAARAYHRRQLSPTPAHRPGTGLNVSAASCWCSTARRSGVEQPAPAGLARAAERFTAAGAELGAARVPPAVPDRSGHCRRRTAPRPDGADVARPRSRPPGPRSRAWAATLRAALVDGGRPHSEAWSTRFSPTRADVPGSCLRVASSRPTGFACSNRNEARPEAVSRRSTPPARPRAVARLGVYTSCAS